MLELLPSEAQVYDLGLILTSVHGSLLLLLLLLLRSELVLLAWVLAWMLAMVATMLLLVATVMPVIQDHPSVTLSSIVSKVGGLLLRCGGRLASHIRTIICLLSSVLLPVTSLLLTRRTPLIALFLVVAVLVGARH